LPPLSLRLREENSLDLEEVSGSINKTIIDDSGTEKGACVQIESSSEDLLKSQKREENVDLKKKTAARTGESARKPGIVDPIGRRSS